MYCNAMSRVEVSRVKGVEEIEVGSNDVKLCGRVVG